MDHTSRAALPAWSRSSSSETGESQAGGDSTRPVDLGRQQHQQHASATSATSSASSKRKGGKRTRAGLTCVQCRKLKMTCLGGQFPCDRCWRLCLNCRPQDFVLSAAEADVGQSGAEEGPPTSPLLELAFARATPRANAELMSQAFMALHAQGRVVRERALFAIRLFKNLAQMMGSDPSYGVGEVIASALGCTSVDMEPPSAEVLLGPGPAQRDAALRARMAQMKEAAERMRADPGFQELEEQSPGTAVLLADMRDDGAMAFTTNATFDAWFQSADRFLHDMIRYKTIFPLLIASLIDPDDRKAMLEAIVKALFGAAVERESLIVKAFDSQGDMGLFLLHIQSIGPSATAVRVERLPPSRHLTSRPGFHQVLQSFKRMDSPVSIPSPTLPTASASASADTGAASGALRISGLTAIPCRPINPEQLRRATELAMSSHEAVTAGIAATKPEPAPTIPASFILPSARSLALSLRAMTEGWDGVGALARQLSPPRLADLDLLKAIFSEGEDEEGKGGGVPGNEQSTTG